MRRILITAIMLLATVMPLATKGNTLMVCQSGSTTTFMPFYGYYTNMTTRSEFVYPARLLEAMNGGTITSLRFQAQSNFSWTGTFEVKLEVVDDTVFDGAFISSSKAQTVYTGTLEVVDVQGTYYTYHAMTINFDSAFQYNGGNLLVSIGCVTTGNRASQTFRFYAQPMAHVCGVWWTGASTGGMTNAQFLPSAEITYTLNNSGCKGPKSLALSNVTNDEGTLSWTPRGTESSWEMLLDGVAVDTVGTTQYTYTGLTPMTHYTVGVRALCGTSGSEVRSIPLHTDCDTVRHSQLPLVQGFEQMTPSSSKFLERDCWRGLYFNNSNYARILSSTVHTGHNSIALYPSYDTYPNYLILPPIDMVQDLKLTYWVYGQYNTIQVGVMTDPTDSSTFVPMDVVSLPGASWTQQEVLFNSYMDGGHHIAFRVTGSGYCYVDDIMVEAIDCFHPMAVTTSTLTPTSVMVHVDDFTGANSYRIWWSDGTTTDSLYSNYSSVTINNLTSNTHYTISAATVCNDGTVTSSVSTSITTPCQGFTHNNLPVHEKFDSYAVTSSTWDGSANCWTIHNYSNYTFPRITTTHYDPAGGAGHGLSFKTRDMSQPQFAVMPRMDSLSDLNVQFWAQGDASAVLTVGVMSDPTDTTTFVALERIVPATTWTSYDIYLGSDTSGGNFIAFRAGGYATSGSNLHIDEIEISLADSCQHPTMLNITRLTQDSVSVVVDDPMHRGAYRLQVSDGSSTLTANIVGNSHSFGGLTAGTSYTVSAATLCNSVVTSESISRSFTTPCTAVATPWSDGFENYTVFGMPPCYGHLGSGQANRMMGSPYAGSYSITLGNGGGENVLLLPVMDTVSGQMLRFYTKPGSVNNASNGKLEVGYVTNSGDASSFVALGSLAYNDSRFASGDYVDFEIVYPDNLEPGTRMAFRNREQIWNGSWRLDELSVLPAPACMRPDSVRVPDSLITWSDVTVMIYDPQELNSYRLWWTNQSTGETDSTDHYGSNEVLLNGLAGSSSFLLKAASLCDDGTVSSKVSTTFTTPCGAITHEDMPFTEGFEDYELEVYQDHEIGLCWHRFNYYNTTSVIPYVHNQNPHSGSKSIKFTTNQNYRPAFLVMPRVDYLDDVKLSFWVRRCNANYSGIQVGVMSDPTDSTTFVNVATFGSGTYDWTQYEVTFENYTGTGKYIAFRNRVNAPSTTYADIYLDDILLEVVDPCPRAESVAATAIEATLATLTVTDTLTGVSYQALVSDGTWDTTLLFSGTNIVVGGLTPHTLYSVELSTVCDNGLLTGAVTTSFQTTWLCLTIDSLPWNEDFEYMAAGEQAPCWTGYYYHQNGNNAGFVRDTLPYVRAAQTYLNDGNHTADQTLYLLSQSGSNEYLYSVAYLPEIGDTANDLKIRFWYKATSNYADVELLVGISDLGGYTGGEYDTSNFVRHGLIVPQDNYFHEYEVELGNLGNSQSRITLIQRPNPGSYMFGYGYIDAVRVEPTSACHRPLRVTALPLSTDSALVHWTETDSVGTYKVVWHSTVGNDSTVVVGDTTCLLTGLTAATYYSVEVRKLCDTAFTIARSTTFLSQCAVIAHNELPWSEDFESYNVVYNQWSSNPCWTMHDYYNAEGWYPRISNIQALGDKSLMFSPGTNDNTQYAVLPALDDLSDVTLRFHYYGNLRCRLTVGVMSDPTDTTTFVALSTIPYMNSTWETAEVNLATYSGTGHHIALRASRSQATGTGMTNLFVDSVTLSITEACPRPSGIEATATTATTATLTVIDPANIGHYMLYLHRGTTTGNTVDLTMPDSLEIWSQSHTLTALLPQTEYSVEVATICPDGLHTERRTCTFRTSCIMLTGNDLPYIHNFEMGLSTPPSSTSTAFNDPCWTLHDHTGNNYPMLITAEAAGGESSLLFFSQYDSLPQYAITPQIDSLRGLKVSLKLLKNQYYTTSGLQVGTMSDPTDTTTFTALVTLLPDTIGWTDYTVSLATYTGDDQYIAFRHGAGRMSMDNLKIEQDAPCEGIGELSVSQITATSATVYDTGSTGTLHRRVDLYSDNGHITFDTLTQSHIVLNELTPNTVYQLYVRNVCDDGTLTSPAHVQLVTLSEDCHAPSNLQLVDAFNTRAELSWTAGGNEQRWLLEVWGNDFDSLYTLTTNPASIGGLEPGATYHATLFAMCGSASMRSESSDTLTFTTLACLTPTRPEVTVLSTTAARVVWQVEADSYTIEYGPAGFANGEGAQVVATASPYQLSGLTANAQYELHLRANCSANSTSDWSPRVAFTTTVGIEAANEPSLTLYPNPAHGNTTLTVSGIGGEATVSIVDLTGRTLRSTALVCAQDCSTTLELSDLPAGSYFVRLKATETTIVRKLVVR